MSPEVGEILTAWTIRLAVGSYLARVLIDVSGGSDERSQRLARNLWTAGCALYLLHVAAAFHFFHGWSHAHAWRFTAEQTRAVIGLDWGGGLYVNHAFTALWVADVLAWWRSGTAYPRKRRRIYWTVQTIFAFMVLNATVVFGPPIWKWVAAAVCVLLAGSYLSRRARTGRGV